MRLLAHLSPCVDCQCLLYGRCDCQVLAGDVVVHHTGQETGQADRLDTLTVMVHPSSAESHAALIDVPLNISTLDNRPPRLVIGSHLVVDVDTGVSLGLDVLSADDVDTSPQRLTFYVTETPVWGRLERRSAPVNRRGTRSVISLSCQHSTLSLDTQSTPAICLPRLLINWLT